MHGLLPKPVSPISDLDYAQQTLQAGSAQQTGEMICGCVFGLLHNYQIIIFIDLLQLCVADQ